MFHRKTSTYGSIYIYLFLYIYLYEECSQYERISRAIPQGQRDGANPLKTKEIKFYIFLAFPLAHCYIEITAKERPTEMFTTNAKVQVKNAKGEVIMSQEYQKTVFEGLKADDKGKPEGGTPEELLGAAIEFFQKQAGEKGNGVVELLKNATYAYDLGERAKIRQQLVTAAAGPDKAIDKAVKDYMAMRAAMGKPVTEEAARKKLMED